MSCSSARRTATGRARARCSSSGRRVDDEAYRARARGRETRSPPAFAALFERGRRARRADRRLRGARRGSAGRHARGRRRGPLHRRRTTSPGNPAVSLPCGLVEGDLPAGLQLAAAVGDDELLLSVATRLRGGVAMRVQDCNWMQLEEYLRDDDRIVLPLGSVEQHAYLSLAVDVILSERVSVEAAEPLGVPVLPALPYGITPYFAAYPGSPTLQRRDVSRGRPRSCSSRSTGRASAASCSSTATAATIPAATPRRSGAPSTTDAQALWHNWWNAPRTWAGRPGDRRRREPRVVARELPVDAPRGRRAAAGAQADGGHRADARARSARGARDCSATARSAASTSGRTRTSCVSGRRASRRFAT